MRSNSAFRAKTRAAFLRRIADRAESDGLHPANKTTGTQPRIECGEARKSSAVDDLPDHIRKFCVRFFSDNRSLF
jgi:hypothetical protein